MRLLIILLLVILGRTSFSQGSIVYKRNVFGELEVYESQGGMPIGSPLYKIKKNVWGYLEVENLSASTNPFTKRPDYSGNSFNSYQLPAKEIFQTLEVLNKKTEYDQLVKTPASSNNPGTQKLLSDAQTFMQNRSAIATNLLNFYNGNIVFPKRLKDGWYDVTKIVKFDPGQGEEAMGFKPGNDFTIGVCKVDNNRIVEYYENVNIFDLKDGFVFRKIDIDIVSPVNNCKSTYKEKNGKEYLNVYFLDNILDSAKRIDDPQFALYTINTASNFNSKDLLLSVQVARNMDVTRDYLVNVKGYPYFFPVFKPNPPTGDCSNSNITLAFRRSTDKFSIGVVRFNDKSVWITNGLSFSPGTCASTILNER